MKKVKLAFLWVLLVTLASCKKAEKTEVKIPKVWMVSTFAGAGGPGYYDEKGELSAFSGPKGLVVDASGNVFVVDQGNQCIRKITPDGVVTTVAGKAGIGGYADGTGTAALFNNPAFIAKDGSGNLYVTDAGNNVIRKISSSGVVTTIAGSGTYGFADGTGTAARFAYPQGIAVDASNNVYVSDHDNFRIRKITPLGMVSTFAGTGKQGRVDGEGATANFFPPIGMAIDSKGNLYINQSGDQGGSDGIRKITANGVVSTITNSNYKGYLNGNTTVARFNQPLGMACDAGGNVYIADDGNAVVRKISFENGTGIVSTFAGVQEILSQDSPRFFNNWYVNGPAAQAKFFNLQGIAADAKGENIYVSDLGECRIRKISLIDDPAFTAATPEEIAKKNWNNPTGWK